MKCRRIIIMLTAVFATMASSCIKPSAPESVVFPQMQSFEVEAGDFVELRFSAAKAWTLTSDRLWCSFATEAGAMQSTAGEAGEQVIRLDIGGEAQSFNTPSTASLTLGMGTESQIIAKLTRGARQYNLRIYNESGQPIDRITASYGSFSEFYVEANFPFSAISWNESLFDLEGGSLVGSEGVRVKAGMQLKGNGSIEKGPIRPEDGFSLLLANENGKARFSFPIVSEGMGDSDILLNLPYDSPFGIAVPKEGGIYNFSTVCRGDDFVLLAFSRAEADPSWIHLEANGEAAEVIFDANEDSRERPAEIWAFPRALYDELGGKTEVYRAVHPGEGASSEQIEKAYRLTSSCLAMEITQAYARHDEDDGIKTPIAVRTDYPIDYETGEKLYYIPVERIYDSSLMERFGVKAAYEVHYPVLERGTLMIHPLIDGFDIDSYTGFGEHIAEATFHYKDRTLCGDANAPQLEFEPKDADYSDPVPSMGFMIYGPKAGDGSDQWEREEPIYAVFTMDGNAEKLVVIWK